MKYFTELKLSGYKSIQDVTVKLNPGINIFIGPNGSGKSNLLEFIYFLKNPIPNIDEDYTIKSSWKISEDKFTLETKQSNHLTSQVNNKELTSSFLTNVEQGYVRMEKLNFYSLTKNGKKVIEEEGNRELTEGKVVYQLTLQKLNNRLFRDISIIRFNLGSNSRLLSVPASFDLTSKSSFQGTIKDLFSTLLMISLSFTSSILKQKEIKPDLIFKDRFEKLFNFLFMDSLKRYSPIKRIRLSNALGLSMNNAKVLIDNVQLEFKLSDGWYKWEELSDGTKRMFEMIVHVEQTSDLVLLEEPELGIHPHQLSLLMQFLKEQSSEKQIIITTHSPDVLDILNPKDFDNINIVSNKKGKTIVKKLTAKQKQKAQAYQEEVGSIGDYWKHSDLEI